jgi:hypothetical protein
VPIATQLPDKAQTLFLNFEEYGVIDFGKTKQKICMLQLKKQFMIRTPLLIKLLFLQIAFSKECIIAG